MVTARCSLFVRKLAGKKANWGEAMAGQEKGCAQKWQWSSTSLKILKLALWGVQPIDFSSVEDRPKSIRTPG